MSKKTKIILGVVGAIIIIGLLTPKDPENKNTSGSSVKQESTNTPVLESSKIVPEELKGKWYEKSSINNEVFCTFTKDRFYYGDINSKDKKEKLFRITDKSIEIVNTDDPDFKTEARFLCTSYTLSNGELTLIFNEKVKYSLINKPPTEFFKKSSDVPYKLYSQDWYMSERFINRNDDMKTPDLYFTKKILIMSGRLRTTLINKAKSGIATPERGKQDETSTYILKISGNKIVCALESDPEFNNSFILCTNWEYNSFLNWLVLKGVLGMPNYEETFRVREDQ